MLLFFSANLWCQVPSKSQFIRGQVSVIMGKSQVKFQAFQVKSQVKAQLECGPMPNVMVALQNIGGTLCSTPQSLADAHYLTAVQ